MLRYIVQYSIIVVKEGIKMVFYTPEQIAKLLQVHLETVRRYIRNGEMKAGKIGRQYRISETDLMEFYESKKVASSK